MHRPRRLRILLTEGSSTSARQTLYVLGRAGHVIDVCDPDTIFCLARFSRYVAALHRCPPFAADPAGYLQFLQERLDAGHYDVLLPVHDQAYLAARFREALARRVGLAVPDFAAVERVQSKAAFLGVLDELGLPHPPTVLVHTRAELQAAVAYPCYVKAPYSTAGRGVWLVRDPDELSRAADRLEQARLLGPDQTVLIQQPAAGVLGVVQSVFQRGRLVAVHCYEARALGAGGSAGARVSAAHPPVVEHVAAIGRRLNWHGALMLDYLWDATAGRPAYIEANPRIGETWNATRSGVNLCEAYLNVALDRPVAPTPPGRVGVRTHSLLTSLLGAAESGATRRELLAEMGRAWEGRGVYAGGEDEWTRPRDDPLSVVPAAYLALRLLWNPRSAAASIGRAVDRYSLSENAVRLIRRLPA